ncbi:MAG: TIGR00266 family protein [Acidobacteria bacterium]|nr:TIGR00266 family protein [Acidobacteriota bacterium]
MNTKIWYVAENGKTIGPMSEEELRQEFESGRYLASTLVFKQGMSGWTAAGEVPGLAGIATASAAPAVPPPPKTGRADEIDYGLFGDEMQYVVVELDPGESAVAEAGAMMYMEDGIQMDTIFGDGSSSGGGLMDKLLSAGKRVVTGESLFMTVFENRGTGKRHVAFAAPYPGKIIPMDLAKLGGTLICQKDAFLCAAKGVSIGIAFQKKIGVALFGGEGFIMEKLEGDGIAFANAGGTIVEKELGPGETLRVDTGCIVALMPTVGYDIQFVGGIKSALFGGEGFFFATLTGPGHVWLQSLPFSRLAGRIWQAAPQGGGKDKGEGSILGQLSGIGGIFDGS